MSSYPAAEYLSALRLEHAPSLTNDALYLDYAASPPLLLSSLASAHTALGSRLYANPHSRSPASEATSDAIDALRARLLSELLGLSPSSSTAHEWDVVFTSGATAAARLVADHFNWKADQGRYVYLKDASHTSVVGIRAAALHAGSEVFPLSLGEMVKQAATECAAPRLYAYPTQCNATGRCFSLDLAVDLKAAHPHNYVLLDAAASLATSSLDFSSIPLEHQPDFVLYSAYKTYGYPTGLGCLFVKKPSAKAVLIKDTYFGGGTLASMSVQSPSMARQLDDNVPLHRTYEDGTLSYLDLVSLHAVMDNFERLFNGSLCSGYVYSHARQLTQLALSQMSLLRHANGAPVCRIYSHSTYTSPSKYLSEGGTAIAFTLLDAQGQPIGHVELDKLAATNNIHIRTGGLCNLGAVSIPNGLTDAELLDNAQICWDEQEFVGEGEQRKPTGLARISFGAISTEEDVQRWIAFLRRFFVTVQPRTGTKQIGSQAFQLDQLCLYPIKSCAAMIVPPGRSWPISQRGLRHDREWMVVDRSSGRALSQKRHNKMACIRATVDLDAQVLRIDIPTHPQFTLQLDDNAPEEELKSRVCAEQVSTIRHSTDRLNEALSHFIGVSCTLHRSLEGCSTARHSHLNGGSSDRIPIALSNESPFLVVNRASVDHLSTLSKEHITPSAFRSNFVVAPLTLSTASEFAEDHWTALRIGSQVFQVLSYCRRCQMVNVDQLTGARLHQPYNILSQTRRNEKSHLCFGLHLHHRPDLSEAPHQLQSGLQVEPIIDHH